MVAFINKLRTDINWECIYDEHDIKLHTSKDCSPFSKDFLLGKSHMVIRKKDFKKKLTIDFLYNLVYNPYNSFIK